MIYDCFQFFNELDLLKLRLHVMDPIVDKFVISEATETFSGMPKPLYYEENKEMFAEFEHKIIHVVERNTPPGPTHVRDYYQKNSMIRALHGAKPDDIILFSDLDEIPNPQKVEEILNNFDPTKIYHFAQRMFYCFMNMEEVSGKLLSISGDFEGVEQKQWIGSKMLTYGLLKEQNLQMVELRDPERKEIGIRVADGGWHFGYMGGHDQKDAKKRLEEKVRSAAHQEYNSAETLADAMDNIRDGKDIFGRDAKFVMVPIDESFPQYLRDHRADYEYLILEEETALQKKVRHARAWVRRNMYRVLRKVRRMLHL